MDNRTQELVILDRIRYAASHVFEEQYMDALFGRGEIHIVRRDDAVNELIANFSFLVAGKETKEKRRELVEKVPASWWDGFKVAWFPTWLLLRFPPTTRDIYHEFDAVTTHVCPHLDAGRGDRRHLEFCLQAERKAFPG